ncbi:unnamed protein product [Trichobilharzia regenti]|nr:unnamed protein product [Trichobilharzia regenti]
MPKFFQTVKSELVVNSMTLKNLSNPSSLKIDLALQLVRETYDTIKQNSNNQRNVVDYCPNEIRELYLSDVSEYAFSILLNFIFIQM